jgi:hypothetical protein
MPQAQIWKRKTAKIIVAPTKSKLMNWQSCDAGYFAPPLHNWRNPMAVSLQSTRRGLVRCFFTVSRRPAESAKKSASSSNKPLAESFGVSSENELEAGSH